MTTPQIIHPDGEWLLNSGTFSFYDPEAQVLFPPNVRVKAKYSNWAKGQPTIAPAADPLADIAAPSTARAGQAVKAGVSRERHHGHQAAMGQSGACGESLGH